MTAKICKAIRITGSIIAGVVALTACPALANDTSITFIGGVPRMQQEKLVAMKSEKLEFRYVQPPAQPKAAKAPFCPSGWYENAGACMTEAYWQADLLYTFSNLGPARTLTIGLPFEMPPCGAEQDIHGPDLCDKAGVRKLSTDIDGKAAAVTRQDVKVTSPVAFNRLYSVTVPFAKGQTRTLRHRYQSYAISSVEGRRFRYLLRTGSTWAGPIGRVDIGFELPPGHGPCTSANLPNTYDGRWVRIGLNNWKPDRDLDIVFASRDRALVGTGVFSYGRTLGEVCEDALQKSAAERNLLADQIDLLYGAPLAGKTIAAGLGAMNLCSTSMYFNKIGDPDLELGPVTNVNFMPDPAFPGNMPALLRQCVAQLRK